MCRLWHWVVERLRRAVGLGKAVVRVVPCLVWIYLLVRVLSLDRVLSLRRWRSIVVVILDFCRVL